MNRNEVESKIRVLIQHSLNGYEVESSKIDFKLKWYDLSDKKRGVNEFVKDVTAIANTIGLDGFIIIGFNDKKKEFRPTKFKDCRLNDSTEMQNLIIRKCSNLFTLNTFDFLFEGNPISVIHIPPTIDKPILVLNYEKYDVSGKLKKIEEQRVFVRKNSMNSYATKNDIELMFYDRKNLSPDYAYELNLISHSTNSKIQSGYGINRRDSYWVNNLILVFNLENLGTRNIVLKSSRVFLDSEEGEIIMDSVTTVNENTNRRAPISHLISTVKPNKSKKVQIGYSEMKLNKRIDRINLFKARVEIILANGKLIGNDFELK